MSFRGGSRGGRGGRGGGSRGGGRGGGGGGRGGGRNFGDRRSFQDQGPPDRIVNMGFFKHSAQDDLVCKATIEDVPFFNAPVYLENKQMIGKIDEIFGPYRDYYVSVRPIENVHASSFEKKTKVSF